MIQWGRIFYFLIEDFFGVLDSLRVLWGRISCFLTRDCFCVLRSIGKESFASSTGMMLDRLDPFEEESSASFLGILLKMLELLRKNLLPPLLAHWESFDDFVPNWGNFEMFSSFERKDFFFLFLLFMTKLHVV